MEPPIPLLTRREIEAGIAAPLLRVFIREYGERKALTLAEEVFAQAALASGQAAAERFGGYDLTALARAVRGLWAADGALDVVFLEETERVLAFDVTRCAYAEAYERLGVRDLGGCLSCSRDAWFARGFNPEIRMNRSATIMKGAPRCDFRFTLPPGPG